MSEEALARRARSFAILKEEGVPYIDHLPVIETEAESVRRSTEEVALRTMALALVAAKGEGLEQEHVDNWIERFDLAEAFTPQEREFIQDPDPDPARSVHLSWRYECCWVLLWALGYFEELHRPDTMCDPKKVVSLIFGDSREAFIKNAKLRSQKDLLDAADLIYRYHWAAVEAQVNNGDDAAGLHDGVCVEHHRALNWLIGHMNAQWDDVSTDT
ncbi:DUF4272 domain-containing protein [Planctomycetes bacterium Pan216]